MDIAGLPAALTLTNLGLVDVGIANVVIPAGQSVTVNLSLMGPARKCDIWLTADKARLAGLLSTSPTTTSTISDAWRSAHHYRPLPELHLGRAGQDTPTIDEGGQIIYLGGQGENLPPSGYVPPGGGPLITRYAPIFWYF